MAPATASPTDQKWRAMVIVHAPMISPRPAMAAMPSAVLLSSSGQSTLPKLDRQIEHHDAETDGDQHRDRADDQPGHAAAEQVGVAVHGRGVEVLGHPVVLAVVDDGPAHAGDDHAHQDVERVAQVDVGEHRVLKRAIGDHRVHHHQDQHAGQRPHDGVDGEQKGVGPVGLDLPAQPGGDHEAAQGVAAPHQGNVENALRQCHG